MATPGWLLGCPGVFLTQGAIGRFENQKLSMKGLFVKDSDLLKPAAPWTGETWAGRIDQSASMLFCHGYISMSQREKIGKKLELKIQGALFLCQDEGCPHHGTDHVCGPKQIVSH